MVFHLPGHSIFLILFIYLKISGRHAYMRDTQGTSSYFVSPDRNIGIEEVFHLNLPRYGYGLTNCGKGEISARTNPKNTRIQYHHKTEKNILAISGSGDRFHYAEEGRSQNFFQLKKWERPSGIQTIYDYNGDLTIGKVSMTNRNGNVFSFLNIDQKGAKLFQKTCRLEMTAFDGRTLCYHFVPLKAKDEILPKYYISEVIRPNAPKIDYEYLPNQKVLCKRYPESRYQALTYYEASESTGTKSYGTYLRVKELIAPVGCDSFPIVTNRFVYHMPVKAHISGGSTEVYDALGHKSVYHYNQYERITHVEKFKGSQLYSTNCFYWGEGDNACNLYTKILVDQSGTAQCAQSYFYDNRGNVLYEKTSGNLSGLNQKPIVMGSNGYPVENGVEYFLIAKSYSQDGLNLLLSETDGRMSIHYSYLPGKNLVASKLVYEGSNIRLREFYEYDELNALLIKKIQDNGTSKDKNNLSGVTERHITLIVPKQTIPCFGLPHIVEERYIDFQTGEEKLFKCLVNSYTREGWIETQTIYDTNRNKCYTLYWKYDKLGNVIEENDPLGNITKRTFDPNGNLLSEQGSKGTLKEFSYDYSNRLISEKVTDIDGTSLNSNHQYDTLSNRIKTTDAYGVQTRFQYDEFNRLQSLQKENAYDENGTLSTSTTTQSHNVLGHTTEVIDPFGNVTTTTYNIRGQPTKIVHPDGTSETSIYNLDGTLKSHTDRYGNGTTYTYDFLKRPIQQDTFSPDGTLLKSISNTYDALHLISTKDPEGIITTYTYDGAGRLSSENKEGRTIKYEYDNLNRKHKVIQNESVAVFVYDFKNQVVEERIEDLQGHVIRKAEFAYDANGNRTKIIQDNAITITAYNGYNQPTKITDALGNSTIITYDHQFRNRYGQIVLQITSTDPLGTTTCTTYDTWGRAALQENKNPYGKLIAKKELFYNARNQLTHSIDSVIFSGEVEKEIHTLWEYNRLGFLVHLTEALKTPEQKHTHHHYNVYGQKEITVKPDGIELHYAYDIIGRLELLSSSDDTIAYGYSYDRNNLLIQCEDLISHQKTTRRYNSFGEVVQEDMAHGLTLKSNFDIQGRLNSLALPDGSEVTYAYDAAYLRKVSYKEMTHQYVDYDSRGNLLKSKLIGEAGEIQFAFDQLKRPTSILSEHFRQENISYDPAGNLLGYEIASKPSSFSYDELYQLKTEEGIAKHDYQNDSLNNRRERDGIVHTHNALNQLLSQGDAQYTYDSNGNLTRVQNGEEVSEYTFDALNRLTSVIKNDLKISYTYDPFNRRLTKKTECYTSPTLADYIWGYKC